MKTRMAAGYDLTVALTYYTPYMSGLTEVARMVAEGLAGRGWRVAVVTTQHDRRLPLRETRNAVDVFRAPVLARVGRGVISPAFPTTAARIASRSAVLNLHVPMLEAGAVAWLSRATPLVINHHDDVWLPGGGLSAKVQVAGVDHSVRAALLRSVAVVVNNTDHAQHSRHWQIMRDRAVLPIAPPCYERLGGQPSFRETPGLHVGFLGRIAHEKGLQYLIDAFRRIPDPDARLLLGGDYANVAGGSSVQALRARAGGDPRVKFLGLLTDSQVADLYASMDVFALTSVAEESFGIVQVEAMMAGVPVVACDLPGMRVPVQVTGFGSLVPPRDPSAIAVALAAAGKLSAAKRSQGMRKAKEAFGADVALDSYEAAFRTAAGARLRSPVNEEARVGDEGKVKR